MGERKHTPGPWSPDFGESYRVRDRDGGCVAIISQMGEGGKFGGRRGDDVASANAHLIASAPDLLEALEGLLQHFHDFTHKDGRMGWGNQEDAYYCLAKHAQKDWERARAAIARAKGKGSDDV